uniref:Uncharacterized protein n=1 Tax=Rhizophora mucronata TaxID=61149 RepID=A0A2P2PLP4_RHIMU
MNFSMCICKGFCLNLESLHFLDHEASKCLKF